MRITTTYDRITEIGIKNLPCPVCGKRIRRQRTFGQTVNPFNRNPDGTIKTPHEVHEEVAQQAKAWQTEPETHESCEAGEQP